MSDDGSVEIKDLVKTYVDDRGRPTFTAVKNISLHIETGEFMVLVGPSGCGKSTTLRMVAGLEKITSGTISIGGRVVNELEPKDRGIAMVFQNIIEVLHRSMPAILLQSLLGFEPHDGRWITGVLVGVDHPRRRMVLSAQGLGQKALGRCCIAFSR